MIDHLSVGVSSLTRSRGFYDKVLKTLGYKRILSFPQFVGYGRDGKPSFWLGQVTGRAKLRPMPGFHVAFVAADRKSVDRFYKAAIAAGAKDNGKPGPRPLYHADYYGAFVYSAFVIDPDGHHIEAVCHQPE
ncbi:MAG: VOC family protein [Rhodospirillaceae bacterium]|nr:VOC family protein [Rhodospirillaceae bacterium]